MNHSKIRFTGISRGCFVRLFNVVRPGLWRHYPQRRCLTATEDVSEVFHHALDRHVLHNTPQGCRYLP